MSKEKTLKQTLDYLVKSKIANKDTMIFLNYVGKEVDKEKDLMFGTVEDIRINYKEKLTDYVEEISFNTINIVNGNIGSIKVTLRENELSSLLYDLKSIYDNFINEETKIKSFKIPQISNVSDSDEDNIDKKSISLKSCEENELTVAEGLHLKEGAYYLKSNDSKVVNEMIDKMSKGISEELDKNQNNLQAALTGTL